MKKTLGPRAALLVTSLYERNRPIFRLKEAGGILGLDAASSRNFIRKLVDRGIAARLKPGLYALIPFELGRENEYAANPLVVAREIAGGTDYYISHGSAMEVHGMVTQPRLVVYMSTLKPRRPVNIQGVEFRFIRSRKKYFWGLCDHWVTKQERVKVSDLERTVIDCLRQPEYCGGLTDAAKGLWMRRDDINVGRLIGCALKMGIGSVIRRLGYLIELYEMDNAGGLDSLRRRLTDTYVLLDPLLPPEGKFLRKWRLRLNVSAEEILSAVRG